MKTLKPTSTSRITLWSSCNGMAVMVNLKKGTNMNKQKYNKGDKVLVELEPGVSAIVIVKEVFDHHYEVEAYSVDKTYGELYDDDDNHRLLERVPYAFIR